MNNGTNKFALRLSCLALQSNSTAMANKKASSGIAKWPEDERPRERLLSRGPHALTDAELVAILLRVGVQGKSAVELGRELLKRFGSIQEMMAAPLSAWEGIKGLKEAKRAQLLAALELGRMNEHLKEEGNAVHYKFHFLTPRDFNSFFQSLKDGSIAGLRSKLDVKLAEEE